MACFEEEIVWVETAEIEVDLAAVPAEASGTVGLEPAVQTPARGSSARHAAGNWTGTRCPGGGLGVGTGNTETASEDVSGSEGG